MKIAVLGSPTSWYLKDLERAAAGLHDLVPVTFRDLASALGPEGLSATSAGADLGRVDLRSMNALLVRTMPPGSLEQVVFRMDLLARLEAAGLRVVNPAKAIEASVDKYLTTARLQAAGLRVPRTYVCQTVEDALQGFAALGGDVVVKPLFGAEGRGIARLCDEAIAQHAFSLLVQSGAVLYLQEFVPHEGSDLRVLVVGDRTWGMRRRNPLDWRTNVSRGATPEPLELTAELVDLAHRAAAAVAAPLAGVDLLPGRDGHLYAIEVNAVPGWQALSRTLGVDIARAVLDYLAQSLTSPMGSRLLTGNR
jgi:tetrahydromethanopterin:alpha-L-glutamate ligase